MKKLVFMALVAAAPLAFPGHAQIGRNATNGTCSPIVGSAKTVIVRDCGIGAAAARRLQDSINRSIADNNLTLAQIKVLVSLLNSLLTQSSATEQKLDRIIRDLEAEPTADARPMGEAGGGRLLRQVLDRTVQHVGDIRITLTRIESGAGRTSIYFDLVNEGMVEIRNIDVFGAGAFGNGGSSLIVSGQEIRATGVAFGGTANQGIVRTDIVPRVRYTGRVDFDGFYGDAPTIDVFKLALSNNNLRPSVRAIFILGR